MPKADIPMFLDGYTSLSKDNACPQSFNNDFATLTCAPCAMSESTVIDKSPPCLPEGFSWKTTHKTCSPEPIFNTSTSCPVAPGLSIYDDFMWPDSLRERYEYGDSVMSFYDGPKMKCHPLYETRKFRNITSRRLQTCCRL